ncbi:MAG: hypothetical protein ACKODX_19295 [Gemmata sp.]
MKRLGAFALVVALSGGCAAPARYIEKKNDTGVVAIPDNSQGWPTNNRRSALELIEKHVGPNYEIVSEGAVPTGRAARAGLPATYEPLNPRNPAVPAQRPIGPNASFQANPPELEGTEYRIVYRKTNGSPAARELQSQEPAGTGPAGGTNTVQTQYQSGGAAPAVQPAGGLNSSFNRGTVPPATGGADCNH